MFGFAGQSDFADEWRIRNPIWLDALSRRHHVTTQASGLPGRVRLKRVTVGLTRKSIDEGSGRARALRLINLSTALATNCWAGWLAPFRYKTQTHFTKKHFSLGREQL